MKSKMKIFIAPEHVFDFVRCNDAVPYSTSQRETNIGGRVEFNIILDEIAFIDAEKIRRRRLTENKTL